MTEDRLFLCRVEDIPDPGSKGFSIEEKDMVEVFAVRMKGELRIYKNRCPHTGAPLEWKPDQFLDFEDRYIQCAMHGALFEPGSGFCIRGPCVGNSLKPQAFEIEGSAVYLVKSEESKADTAPGE